MLLSPEKHANIGVFLYQQLRLNALATYQPDFADSADWLFRRWQRYELKYKYEHPEKYKDVEEPLGDSHYWWKWVTSHLYELSSGFGHSLFRFAVTSLLLFLAVVTLNHWLWKDFEADTALKAGHAWFSSFYYTAITLTTVGYGDITPRTITAMMVAAVEAVAGFFWFALLASMLVRRVLR